MRCRLPAYSRTRNSNDRGGCVSARLVIVDDSITNLKILERLAASLDERIAAKSFADPEEALRFCLADPPDLVLLAASDAAGEAAGFIALLREGQRHPGTPVIVIGAPEELDCIERAREAGAVDHMLVPIDPGDFRVRVRAQLL